MEGCLAEPSHPGPWSWRPHYCRHPPRAKHPLHRPLANSSRSSGPAHGQLSPDVHSSIFRPSQNHCPGQPPAGLPARPAAGRSHNGSLPVDVTEGSLSPVSQRGAQAPPSLLPEGRGGSRASWGRGRRHSAQHRGAPLTLGFTETRNQLVLLKPRLFWVCYREWRGGSTPGPHCPRRELGPPLNTHLRLHPWSARGVQSPPRAADRSPGRGPQGAELSPGATSHLRGLSLRDGPGGGGCPPIPAPPRPRRSRARSRTDPAPGERQGR